MMTILKEANWALEVQVNHEGVIENIFFAHPGLIHLAHISHHIALLDDKYKTNQYQIPLLHIISQTSTNQLFWVGFCFLTKEDDTSYLWAVECLQKHLSYDETKNHFEDTHRTFELSISIMLSSSCIRTKAFHSSSKLISKA
ncbi:hypothetical protein PSTG_11463 [Puccinia striiformis f. sp. tritici PST-78]|uniref:MULE transposase domain-containing protein n=1 Tax=Puccinia striiformis f. sp. tritici PST-78 TaxID=1165861 RepID=A0A0L0V7D9_9BASI|nr:hypothetical protein PSTG_11463 [Puccinia striiformis f. sp. tritici PST-78]